MGTSSKFRTSFRYYKGYLTQYIPFIRFYNLTSKEFMDKVYPYKKILPKELREDLLITFLNLLEPDSKPSKPRITKEINLKTVDSKIITYQHAELISKWIDKLEITDKVKNSYEFKLLFRGSRDGFTPEKFHKFCVNKSRTVTVAKVEDSDEILGGYNPIAWNSDKYGFDITKDS